jgi:GMP synthase (glutamine-hydrolysing)
MKKNILILDPAIDKELVRDEKLPIAEVEYSYNLFQWIQEAVKFDIREQINFIYTDAVKSNRFPEIKDLSGIIIGGSGFMIGENNDSEWLNNIKEYVKKASGYDKAILGICFGHQLLANIFGAKVIKKLPREFGKYKLELSELGVKDKLFSNYNNQIEVFEAHCEIITDCDSNTIKSLAYNNHHLHQAIAINNNIRGVQFHPEFNCQFMKAIWSNNRKEMLNEGFSIKQAWESINRDVNTKGIIDNFVRYFIL